jgi:putative transcriptional regulator
MDTPVNSGHFVCLDHHFLIAMPGLLDPAFAHSLVYICKHTPDGAMGLRIDHALDVTLRELFLQLHLPCNGALADHLLLAGGPVRSEWGFVLHPKTQRQWQSTLDIADGVALTASRDIIEALATGVEAPEHSLVALGYAGWGAGQLEEEIKQNAWLSVAADPLVIFDLAPEERLPAAMKRLGIDFASLSEEAGHA